MSTSSSTACEPIFGISAYFDADPELFGAIESERHRQQDQVELIASENIVSEAVLAAQGSVLTNKYAEGYPGRRYYGGCEFVDVAERLAIERATKLFDCGWVNVQPHSGAQANQTVMLGLLRPGDTVLGMSLAAGGHLSHGAKPNMSGKWLNAVQYGVREADGRIDMDEVACLAKKHRPTLIIAGASAYSREIDFAVFRAVADSVDAYLHVDMAHIAGLVAAGAHPSPLPHAHVVTSTTHKTLRGPRGGMVLSNNAAIGKKMDSAMFPGLQGGPLMHVIAAKAVALGEALQPTFADYIRAMVANAQALAGTLKARGVDIVTGGTDNHMLLVDLRKKGLTGKVVEAGLERAGLTCNKNAVPFDPRKPSVTSGIRLGSPAATSRGFGVAEFRQVGELIGNVLGGLAKMGPDGDAQVEARTLGEVRELCQRFPIYQHR